MNAIRYQLSEADFYAFNLALLRRLYVRQLFNVLSTGAGVGLVAYLLLKADTHDTRASAISAVALGLICSGLWVLYVFSALRAGVKKHFATDPSARAVREVIITPEGFRERTADNDSFHTWSGLHFVHLTSKHLFVFNTALTAYIVPRSLVATEDLSVLRLAVPKDRMRDDQGA